MTHTNTTRINGHELTRVRTWNFWSVRDACIKNNLYTCGTSQEYDNMLDHVSNLEPTTAALFHIAMDIVGHSEDQTVTNIMYILERDAVITTFEIDGSDNI